MTIINPAVLVKAKIEHGDVPLASCQNCDWVGPAADTGDISHYSERVEPGEDEPCGECPECGSLCHEIGA